MLSAEFNSVQHQTQTREYLYNLSVESVRAEKKRLITEALEHVHTRILDRVPQCGCDYQKDYHMCEFMYLAERGQKWAREVLTERGSGGQGKESMKYSTFYLRLTAAAGVCQVEEQDEEADDFCNNNYFVDTYAHPCLVQPVSGSTTPL